MMVMVMIMTLTMNSDWIWPINNDILEGNNAQVGLLVSFVISL